MCLFTSAYLQSCVVRLRMCGSVFKYTHAGELAVKQLRSELRIARSRDSRFVQSSKNALRCQGARYSDAHRAAARDGEEGLRLAEGPGPLSLDSAVRASRSTAVRRKA